MTERSNQEDKATIDPCACQSGIREQTGSGTQISKPFPVNHFLYLLKIKQTSKAAPDARFH